MKTLQIDFVSDIACPWCAVGLHALERAAASLPPDVQLQWRFQPFELNPQMAPEGEAIVPHLAAKYGIDEAQIRRNQAGIRERGAAVGFTFGTREHIWNTFAAHRLLHWAGLQGAQAQRRLKHALLTAYHGQGHNPGETQVLVDAARAAGLPADEAREVVESGRYADEVRAAESRWQRLGISAVPSVVVNMRHLIQGAQPPEAFAQALAQIAAEPEPATEPGAGGA